MKVGVFKSDSLRFLRGEIWSSQSTTAYLEEVIKLLEPEAYIDDFTTS